MNIYKVNTSTHGEQEISIKNLDTNVNVIFVSGGIDSALLLELYTKHDVHIVPYYIDRGKPKEYEAAKRINDKVNERYNLQRELKIAHVGHDNSHNGNPLVKACMKIGYEKIDKIISGDNTNPPYQNPTNPPPNRTSPKDMYKYPKWELPLLHVDKSYIIQLCLDIECEWIFELSRSCGLYFNECEDLGIVRCGECFSCTERSWAFGIVGSKDPGQY